MVLLATFPRSGAIDFDPRRWPMITIGKQTIASNREPCGIYIQSWRLQKSDQPRQTMVIVSFKWICIAFARGLFYQKNRLQKRPLEYFLKNNWATANWSTLSRLHVWMLRSETLLIVPISTKKKVSVKHCSEHCILDIFYIFALCAFSHLQTSGRLRRE